jgi:hypothetical protein
MRTLVLAIIGVLSFAGPSAAADPVRIEAAGGHVFLRDVTRDESFNGWLASFGASLGQSFDLVGEVSGCYDALDLGITTARVSETSVMGGVKFVSHEPRALTPFFQILIGGVRVNASALGASNAESYFAAQPGGGVDAALTPRIDLRLEADYRVVQIRALSDKHVRFLAGLVFHD